MASVGTFACEASSARALTCFSPIRVRQGMFVLVKAAVVCGQLNCYRSSSVAASPIFASRWACRIPASVRVSSKLTFSPRPSCSHLRARGKSIREVFDLAARAERAMATPERICKPSLLL